MPSYYFHIRDNGTLFRDPDGLELRDLRSAIEECRKIMSGVLGEDDWQDQLMVDRQFEVVDELERTVLVVPFSELAVRPAGRQATRRRSI